MRVLVLGSGAVGAAVAEALSDHEVVLTGRGGLSVDFRDQAAWAETLAGLGSFEALVHAAGVVSEDWEQSFAVNVKAFETAARLPGLEEIVCCTALAPGQSLPLPATFAATQGALCALVMALAKELGPDTRVNGLALGPLEHGLSETLPPEQIAQYLEFSALRRRGTAKEVAIAIRWLLTENSYISGQVIPLNGGL